MNQKPDLFALDSIGETTSVEVDQKGIRIYGRTLTKAAAVLGRKGGKVKSAKKTEAARRNAKLPRKKV